MAGQPEAGAEAVSVKTDTGRAGKNGTPRKKKTVAAMVSNSLSPSERSRRVDKQLNSDLLQQIGYDFDSQIFAPDAADPLFGYSLCERENCESVAFADKNTRLCGPCLNAFKKVSGGVTLADFKGGSKFGWRLNEGLCRVCCVAPDYLRPASGADLLCRACSRDAKSRGDSADQYVSYRLAGPGPRRGFGECRVNSCSHAAEQKIGLCPTHLSGWKTGGRPEAGSNKFRDWLDMAGSAVAYGEAVAVSFKELTRTLQDELLLVLQIHSRRKRMLRIDLLGLVARQLLEAKVSSVFDYEPAGAGASLVRMWRSELDFELTTRDEEAQRPVWRLSKFGFKNGRADFSQITIPKLNASARAWANLKADEIDTHGRINEAVNALAALCVTITELKAEDPRYASIESWDQEVLRKHQQRLEARSKLPKSDSEFITPRICAVRITTLSQFLKEVRSFGLTDPGKELAGLPASFNVSPGVSTKHSRALNQRKHIRRDIPRLVIAQLLKPEVLAEVEDQLGLAKRVAVELQFAAGRRTEETCKLRANAVTFGLDGGAELELNCGKDGPQGLRVPIKLKDAAAEAFKRQQQKVIDAHPGSDLSELALFPSPRTNPDGVKGMGSSWLEVVFRVLREIPHELVGPDGNEFDRDLIFPYAARHSWAQALADAKVPIDRLTLLMGHSTSESTRCYYVATALMLEDTMAAVTELLKTSDGSLEDPAIEAALRRTGALPVPLGGCFNAQNIAASGNACPLGGRCASACKHLRTDVRWLPAWELLYTQLLEFLVRLDSPEAKADAPDWALDDARPSEHLLQEVARMRRQLRAQLDELPEADRVRLKKILELQQEAHASGTWFGPSDNALQVRFDLPQPPTKGRP